MKKNCLLIMSIVMAAALFTGCGSETEADSSADSQATSEVKAETEDSASSDEASSEENVDDTDAYTVCTDISSEDVDSFAALVKESLINGDWNTIASVTAYPITILGTTYKNEEEIVDSDITLSDGFFTALQDETCNNMFANDEGIMLGDGQVWISEVLDDSGKSEGLKITAINDEEDGDDTANVSDIAALSKHSYVDLLTALDVGDPEETPVLLGDEFEYDCLKDHYFLLSDLDNDGDDDLIVNKDAGKELGDYLLFTYDMYEDSTVEMSSEDVLMDIPTVWENSKDSLLAFDYDTCMDLEKDYEKYMTAQMQDIIDNTDGTDLGAAMVANQLQLGSAQDLIALCGDNITFKKAEGDAEVEYSGEADGQEICTFGIADGAFIDYTEKTDGVYVMGIQLGDSMQDAFDKLNADGWKQGRDYDGDGMYYFEKGISYDSFSVNLNIENEKVIGLNVSTNYKYAG